MGIKKKKKKKKKVGGGGGGGGGGRGEEERFQRFWRWQQNPEKSIAIIKLRSCVFSKQFDRLTALFREKKWEKSAVYSLAFLIHHTAVLALVFCTRLQGLLPRSEKHKELVVVRITGKRPV